MQHNERTHLWKMDVLRGMAILGVFAYHCQIFLYPGYETPHYQSNGLLQANGIKALILNLSPINYGWAAVPLFLMISGFLIHLGFLSCKGRYDYKTFFSKRFWRIYPPYILALFFFFFWRPGIMRIIHARGSWADLVAHILLIHNLSIKTLLGAGNPAFWSLALEAQLYLVYPLFLWIRRKTSIKKAFLVTVLLNIMTFTILACWHSKGSVLATSLPAYWVFWSCGALLAENYFNKKVCFPKNAPLLFFFSFLITLASKYYMYAYGLLFYGTVFSFFVFIEWFLLTPRIHMHNWLCKAIAMIGICSYSIYLIHQPLLPRLFVIFKKIIPWQHFPIMMGAAFIIIFIASYFLHQFVELPSIAFGQKLRVEKK